jgi:TP901 family phage tail tape measure protein
MSIKIRIVSDFDKKGLTEAERALNGLSKAAGLALAAVGAAVAGIAVKSVQEFAKFDAALTKSQAIMGDLTKTMEKDMSDAAREVAKVTTFSAEEAAESFFFLASAGLDAEASIAALPRVAQFAQAGMFDMSRATDLLTDAQSALGLTIRDDAVKNMENMIKVSDVLVRANTLSNATVEQFSTSLTTKAGAALRGFGIDMEEGVAVLAAFADQGIKGEEAGTRLEIVLKDLSTKAIINKEDFAALGVSVFDSNGEMRNLGDIIGNLEGATRCRMSDETKLRRRCCSLDSLTGRCSAILALLGTSDAIKNYETELRSASGFTNDSC